MAKVPFLSFFFALVWITYYGLSSTEFYAKYSIPIIIATFILTSIPITLICIEFCKLDDELEYLETRLNELEKKVESEETDEG